MKNYEGSEEGGLYTCSAFLFKIFDRLQ